LTWTLSFAVLPVIGIVEMSSVRLRAGSTSP